MGGIPNKAQVGDMGIDGRIFPLSALPEKVGKKKGEAPIFDEFMDAWYPIQVKQKDKVGRPDIDSFEAMMVRANRDKGVFAKGRRWCSRRPRWADATGHRKKCPDQRWRWMVQASEA